MSYRLLLRFNVIKNRNVTTSKVIRLHSTVEEPPVTVHARTLNHRYSNFTNQLLTSSVQPLQQNARCKLINNAPVQRARKLLEGPNSSDISINGNRNGNGND